MMLYAVMLMACVVLFNHTGLMEAVEAKIHYKFKILSCGKCGTFWSVLLYLLATLHHPIVSITAAFVLSYMAIWFELLLGYMNYLYETAYDKIQAAEADKAEANAKSEMPEV